MPVSSDLKKRFLNKNDPRVGFSTTMFGKLQVLSGINIVDDTDDNDLLFIQEISRIVEIWTRNPDQNEAEKVLLYERYQQATGTTFAHSKKDVTWALNALTRLIRARLAKRAGEKITADEIWETLAYAHVKKDEMNAES